MDLMIYDTYERKLRAFEPLHSRQVGLYACGPTVYDYAHIGNLRTYLFGDTLRRVLALNGYAVRHVINITDVGHLTSDADTGEDKMEKGSRRTGRSAWDMAKFYTDAFQRDLEHLHIIAPTVWAHATDHIAEQIDFIAEIQRNGYAYQTLDGIYFDTQLAPGYGRLGRLKCDGQISGLRVPAGQKRSPADFALWKFSQEGEQRQMEWDSPWGRGFPGWHIECSAMSTKYLGTLFDIHIGGEDHVPVHHTNEIAQHEACHGHAPARYWMHGAFLQLEDGDKMSKSGGGFLRLDSLVERGIDPLAYRYLVLTTHYRSPLAFSWTALGAAQTALNRIRALYHAFGQNTDAEPDPNYQRSIQAELNNDLNTPRALALAWDVLKSKLSEGAKKATLRWLDQVLGLELDHWSPAATLTAPAEVRELLEARQAARAEKRWDDADRVRQQIEAAGYTIQDTADGPVLERKLRA